MCSQLPPGVWVRVSGGHLCKAEAPTEAAAETLSAVWLTEGLLQTKVIKCLSATDAAVHSVNCVDVSPHHG